ncbi:MAG: PA14 domain-containing protein [Chitinophagaceae bacterium]
MKLFYKIILLCLLSSTYVYGAAKYWVGPLNGNWNIQANWSNTRNGSGGAALPGALDSVIFVEDVKALVHVNISPVVGAMHIQGDVTLYASTPVVFTLLRTLSVNPFQTLKDSTSANVPFNFVFSGASGSNSFVAGRWEFEGGVPVNRLAGNGATFTVQNGSRVTVLYIGFGDFGKIIFKNNTNYISSNASSLRFSAGTNYVVQNNLDAAIPNATWAGDSVSIVTGLINRSRIMIIGSMSKLIHLAADYKDFLIDLPGQESDASLDLPDGCVITGNLIIQNTNNKTITLLANTGASPASVSVTLSPVFFNNAPFEGTLNIRGNSRVALAKGTNSSSATNYRLQVFNFNQSAGNFSLQDYNDPLGVSVLGVSTHLVQTGGTFITNSTSAGPIPRFFVEMNGPVFFPTRFGISSTGQVINISGGTINNERNKVTLRISQKQYSYTGYPAIQGVNLQSPLEVGRLELLKGTLNTTGTNIVTVKDPDALSGVMVGNTDSSYVSGPMRRWTNSNAGYLFPTGKGNIASAVSFDSSVVVPSSADPSLYQAEYFNTAYSDLNVTAPLRGVSNAEYWNVSKISGADARVKLFVNAAVPGASSTDGLVVAHYTDGHWITINGSVFTPGNATSGVITSKVLTGSGPVTIGYADPATIQQTLLGGLNYRYYEGAFNMLPDFNALTPTITGNTANIDLEIRRPGVNDSFAIVWEGFINIPAAGTYTFETVSDDGSKLYFNTPYSLNAPALVNNDGTHPSQAVSGTVDIAAPGRYSIAISYFDNYGGESMEAYWTGPGVARQLIPDAAFHATAAPTTSGLSYKYFEGDFNSLPDFTALTATKTGKSANIDFGVRTQGVDDRFAFIWEGYINIPTAGSYTFETVSDDGSKLYFNTPYTATGGSLVSNDGLHASNTATGTILVPAAGLYPIIITYFEKEGGETMQVYWSGPGIPRALIPDIAFEAIAAPGINGLSYKYFEGNFDLLPDFQALTPLKTGKSANVDLGIRTPGVNDRFAVIWEGYINIPKGGNYTFETISDDGSKLYFNEPYSASSNSLVNNDGLHATNAATGTIAIPAAGLYPITITYFEKDGGETMQVYWTGPGIERQLIPDAAFGVASEAPSITGLNYKYYEGNFDALPDFDALPPMKTGLSENVDISIRTPGVNDHFAFIWQGYIDLPTTGTYTFETVSDDGSKIYFYMPYSATDSSLVDNGGVHFFYPATGTITASAGRYPISITYFEKEGAENMQVYWTGPGIERQLIPDAAFSPDGDLLLPAMNANMIITKAASRSKPVAITKIYPNPFIDNFYIDFYNTSVGNQISVGVYDLHGRLVYTYSYGTLGIGRNVLKINLGTKQLSNGTYLAKLSVNGITSGVIKLVKFKR